MNQISNDLSPEEAQQKNRRILLIMTAIIVVPFLLAYTMFRTGLGMPGGTTNQGQLILPPLHIDKIGLRDRDGNALDYQFADGLWTLLLIGEGACDARCQEALYLTRQVHIALGKDANRVVRFYAVKGALTDESTAGLIKAEHPRLVSIAVDDQVLSRYLSNENRAASLPFNSAQLTSESYVLVVDPLGNIMMYYTPEHTGKQMLKDLKKLLKNSKIG